jgi:paraquat-inducible protein A
MVEAMLLPFVRFGLLAAVLIAIRLGRKDAWIGPAFRWSEKLDMWAMADVLLIGAAVGWGRVEALIPVLIDPAGLSLIAAAMFTMLTRAAMDKRAVWRCIARPNIELDAHPIGCTECDLVLPGSMVGQRCPRCRARLHRRRRGAMGYAVALTAAAWALMPVSYFFPMNIYWKLGTPHPQTIFVGIKLLFENGYAPLGVLIFLTSVAFPIGKLLSLSWFYLSIWRRSDRHLRAKIRAYRIVNNIGRWSNLDPFTLVIFVPMGQLRGLVSFQTGGGATAFLFVVALSMAAAEIFDTRLIFDAADLGRRRRTKPAPTAQPTAALRPAGP